MKPSSTAIDSWGDANPGEAACGGGEAGSSGGAGLVAVPGAVSAALDGDDGCLGDAGDSTGGAGELAAAAGVGVASAIEWCCCPGAFDAKGTSRMNRTEEENTPSKTKEKRSYVAFSESSKTPQLGGPSFLRAVGCFSAPSPCRHAARMLGRTLQAAEGSFLLPDRIIAPL